MLLVLPDDNSADIVPGAEDSDMIAVVENDPVIPADTAEIAAPELIYVAKAEPVKVADVKAAEQTVPSEIPATEVIVPADTVEEQELSSDDEQTPVQKQEPGSEWKDEWAEEEETVRKTDISFVVSGLTGTNAAQNETVKDIFKRPDPNPGPATTGVKQTSTNSTYDIPLSFGAGVKIGL
jgi:hypothetical protein